MNEPYVNLGAISMNNTYRFMQRLAKCSSSPIMTIEKSLIVRIDLEFLSKRLYSSLQQYEFIITIAFFRIISYNNFYTVFQQSFS